MIKVRQMAAGLKGFDRSLQQIQNIRLELRPQNTIFSAPDHMQRLGWKRMTAACESTAAGKGSQGYPPIRTTEVEGSNLLLRGADTGIRVGEGLPAEPAANSRA